MAMVKGVGEMVFVVAGCGLEELGEGYGKDQGYWGSDHRLDRERFERVRAR